MEKIRLINEKNTYDIQSLTCSTTSAEEWVCQNELYMEGLWTNAFSNYIHPRNKEREEEKKKKEKNRNKLLSKIKIIITCNMKEEFCRTSGRPCLWPTGWCVL